MESTRFIIIALFILIYVRIIITGIIFKTKGLDFKGQTPVKPLIFKLGKISSFIVWITPIFAAIYPEKLFSIPGILIKFPSIISWFVIILMTIGVIFFYFSFSILGNNNKFGLPQNTEIELKTEGIYKISRNPMYFGFVLINIASVLYYPHIANIIFAIITTWIHHLILLSEESFLLNQFGKKYIIYKNKTRMYI